MLEDGSRMVRGWFEDGSRMARGWPEGRTPTHTSLARKIEKLFYFPLHSSHNMDNFTRFLELAGLEPKPYQTEGVQWLLTNETQGNSVNGICVRGGLLADEMGLGKTIQMLGVILANPKPHTLIVLPKALLDQWKDVIIDTLHHNPLVYHGSSINDVDLEQLAAAPIVITTYGMISTISKKKRQSKDYDDDVSERFLHKQIWDRVIFDEAHWLRNSKTQAHEGAMKLRSSIRWLVTGTPIQNSRNDFYSLCAAMGIPESYYKVSTNILPLAKQFMMKRTKAEVGIDLPELRNEIVPTNWNHPAELELAEDIHALMEFSGSQKPHADNKMTGLDKTCMLSLLTRARQACIHPPLLKDAVDDMIEEGILDDSEEIRQALQSTSKIDTVVSTIIERKDNGRNKLVFCHYRGEIDTIRENLLRHDLNVRTFDGRVSPKNRKLILTEECDVLILQIKTGCEGLNLQQFSEVYFVSPHWNPAVEDQAVARCHRIGQLNHIDVFRFQSKGDNNGKLFRTLDEYSYEKQTSKRNIMKEIDDTPDSPPSGTASP